MRTYISCSGFCIVGFVVHSCSLKALCLLLMFVRCVNTCDVLKPAKAAAVELLKKTDSSFSGNECVN